MLCSGGGEGANGSRLLLLPRELRLGFRGSSFTLLDKPENNETKKHEQKRNCVELERKQCLEDAQINSPIFPMLWLTFRLFV